MIVVACHDAGGAELVSAWLAQENVEFCTMLGGPAKAIFERKFGETRRAKGFKGADLVLTGTSASADLERYVRCLAAKEGVKTAAYVDHWKNYRQRFETDGRLALPDEVWVVDVVADRIALTDLPGAKVLRKGNPYLAEIARDVRARPRPLRKEDTRVLYVAEPKFPGPNVRELTKISPDGYVYRYRLHPTSGIPQTPLAFDLAWADVVVGYDSMALAAAACLGRRAITLLRRNELSIPRVLFKIEFGHDL